MAPLRPLFFILLLLTTTFSTSTIASSSSNPFTPKSAFLRYYARKVSGSRSRPLPSFLLSKLSPLSAASYSALLSSPSSSLPAHCSSAGILCSLPVLQTPATNSSDVFSSYADSNFTNYGTSRSGGTDSFRAYSPDRNLPVDSFRRYSASSSSRDDAFLSYASDGNVVTADFASYASSAASGSGSFSSYASNANVPDLKFTSYDTRATGRPRDFSSYSDDTNSGSQSFAGYGKNGEHSPAAFTSYASNANVVATGFKGYGEGGGSANDTFTSYGGGGNRPANDFAQYGEGGGGGSEEFKAYDDRSNVGESSFQSYAKRAGGAAKAGFDNYGHSFNPGTDRFKGYGEGSTAADIGFKNYHNENTSFKGYAKTAGSVTFATYRNSSTKDIDSSNSNNNNKWVEPGKFFRESVLKEGSAMTMADIRDKSPRRSFLPRPIASRLPFSAAEVYRIFRLPPDSALGRAVSDTVAECERPPSPGETKRCATSAEDVVDFAVSVLGADVAVGSTEGAGGWGEEVVLGGVRGVNGGRVTESVSCHQSLFPYMVYYCHSVPEVRVYEADILDAAGGGGRINRGVAICHLDTSAWSPTHGAFAVLGSGPGEIEVCHWIFEGDMTWTVAD